MNYDKTEMNAFVQNLYDQKMQEGKHGHYETMFSVVHAAIAAHTAKLLAGVEKTEPVEFWTVAHGWVKVDEVKQHFDSVGCATIYAKEGEEREPLYTKDQLQQYAAAAAAQAREKALDEAKEVVRDILRDEHSDLNYKGASEVQAAIEKLKGGER